MDFYFGSQLNKQLPEYMNFGPPTGVAAIIAARNLATEVNTLHAQLDDLTAQAEDRLDDLMNNTPERHDLAITRRDLSSRVHSSKQELELTLVEAAKAYPIIGGIALTAYGVTVEQI